MRIAYYGGSFNPPHYGHFLVASWALCGGFVDRVWMVPCWQHAFGKDLAPYPHRLEMLRLGALPLGEAVEVSPIEEQLGGPRYTIESIDALVEMHPEVSFRLLVGTDILQESEEWREFERLRQLAPLLVAPRGGYHPENPLGFHIPEISSSAIRRRLSQGLSVQGALPPPILEYIHSHQLYLDG